MYVSWDTEDESQCDNSQDPHTGVPVGEAGSRRGSESAGLSRLCERQGEPMEGRGFGGFGPSQRPIGKCGETQVLQGQQESRWGLDSGGRGRASDRRKQQLQVRYPASSQDKDLLQGVTKNPEDSRRTSPGTSHPPLCHEITSTCNYTQTPS